MAQQVHSFLRISCLLFICLLIHMEAVRSADRVFLIPNDEALFNLNGYLEILEDPKGKLTFEDIKERDSLFRTFDPNVPLNRNSVYWGKIRLKNPSHLAQTWVLSPDWDTRTKSNEFVEMYSPSEVGIQKTRRYLPAYLKDSLLRPGPM